MTIGFTIGSFIFDSSDFNKFEERGVAVYGKVIDKEPQNHARIIYTYNVNGKQYTGYGGAGRGNPRFDQIEIGEQIVVYYDAEFPESSIPGYPQFYRGNNYWGVILTTIFLPIIPLTIIFIFYRVVVRKRL